MNKQKELFIYFCDNDYYDDARKVALLNQNNKDFAIKLLDYYQEKKCLKKIEFVLDVIPLIIYHDYDDSSHNFLYRWSMNGAIINIFSEVMEQDDMKLFKKLLGKFPNIENDCSDIFDNACYLNKIKYIKYLIKKYPDSVIYIDDDDHNTGFIDACRYGFYDIIEYLVTEHHDKILRCAKNGIFYAGLNDYIEIFKLLMIEFDIDINWLIENDVLCLLNSPKIMKWIDDGYPTQHKKIKMSE